MQGSVPLGFFPAGVGRAFQATQKLAPGIEKAFQPQKKPSDTEPSAVFHAAWNHILIPGRSSRNAWDFV